MPRFWATVTPEVVVAGLTGFVCDTVHAMVEAIAAIASLGRQVRRTNVGRHFAPGVMADG